MLWSARFQQRPYLLPICNRGHTRRIICTSITRLTRDHIICNRLGLPFSNDEGPSPDLAFWPPEMDGFILDTTLRAHLCAKRMWRPRKACLQVPQLNFLGLIGILGSMVVWLKTHVRNFARRSFWPGLFVACNPSESMPLCGASLLPIWVKCPSSWVWLKMGYRLMPW